MCELPHLCGDLKTGEQCQACGDIGSEGGTVATINEIEVAGKFVRVDEYRWIRMSSICAVSTPKPKDVIKYVTLGVCTAEFFETVYIRHNTVEEAKDYAIRLINTLSHD